MLKRPTKDPSMAIPPRIFPPRPPLSIRRLRKLTQGVGQAAQLGDTTLRSLTNSLFSAFRSRTLCADMDHNPAAG
jgi:hypothetical protein